MRRNSSADRRVGLVRISAGTDILPTSCTLAAKRSAARVGSVQPRRCAMASASAATRRSWPAV